MTRSNKGFTLVEMMIALAFLSFILIFSATVIVQIMRTYNKGLAIKEIQQTSRALLEEITRNARLAEVSGSGIGFDITKAGSNGRLCLGGFSYIWNKPNNAPFAGEGANAVINRYTNDNPVGIVKIEDTAGVYCTSPNKKIPPDESIKLATDRIRIPEFRARLSADKRLLNLNLVMSTNGTSDAPFKDDGRWQCDVGNFFGVFCAVSDFDTTVYLRNGGA